MYFSSNSFFYRIWFHFLVCEIWMFEVTQVWIVAQPRVPWVSGIISSLLMSSNFKCFISMEITLQYIEWETLEIWLQLLHNSLAELKSILRRYNPSQRQRQRCLDCFMCKPERLSKRVKVWKGLMIIKKRSVVMMRQKTGMKKRND